METDLILGLGDVRFRRARGGRRVNVSDRSVDEKKAYTGR